MPLRTASHFFAPSAGSRPGKAVLTGVDEPFQSLPIAAAMSMSKPTIAPLVVADSIGGNVGAVQKLSDWPAALCRFAPACPAATDAATSTTRASRVVVRVIRSSSTRETTDLTAIRPGRRAQISGQPAGHFGDKPGVDRVREWILA